MKKNSLLVLLLTVIGIAGALISYKAPKDSDKVSISGRKIMVNDAPYLIKGICYHPVSKGSDQRAFENLSQDLKLMKEAGINTIRVYAPIDDIEVLNAVDAAGIKIIMGFGYNQNGNFDILSGSFLDYVNKYKSHKAILLWELGNEYNYHPEWFDGDLKNWYTAMNNAAELIQKNDPDHPVTTAHGELPDATALSACPNIDVWGMNVYRWDDPAEIYSQWAKVSNKPMYLSEAGGDSYMTVARDEYKEGVNEKAQADANAKILEIVFDNLDVGSGVTLFSFTDGWWKAGNNDSQDIGGWAPNSTGVPYDGTPNEEFWGIVDIDRNKKATYDIVKKKYKQVTEVK
ncbi:MAG: hypothetical protein JSV73_05740 [Flavobacteriaceae bacterium]|nr:MAG: hypothetical protein JSV73_05740 [Flavobacteriaceae bacterium]